MPLTLAGIPQILSLLELGKEEKDAILAYAREHKIFAGEAYVAMSENKAEVQEKLDAALVEQAEQKLEAAEIDIDTILGGTQKAPPWLKANWGNNGVNVAVEPSTKIDALSAAANIAQNMVMIANVFPERAKQLKNPIDNLTQFIREHDAPTSQDKGVQWRMLEKGVQDVLQDVVRATGYQAQDAKGNAVDVAEFLKVRCSEIRGGLELERSPAMGR